MFHPLQVLELDPLNVKALFRRSQAYMKTSELEKAEADIKKALAIDPNNRQVYKPTYLVFFCFFFLFIIIFLLVITEK